MQRKDDCLVCNREAKLICVNAGEKVSQVNERLTSMMTLKKPTLIGQKGPLIGAGVYAAQAAALQDMTFAELLEQEKIVADDTYTLTDPSIPSVIEIRFDIDHQVAMTDTE